MTSSIKDYELVTKAAQMITTNFGVKRAKQELKRTKIQN